MQKHEDVIKIPADTIPPDLPLTHSRIYRTLDARPAAKRKGWAGNTLWKDRKLKTYSRQQLMGIAARAMERGDALDSKVKMPTVEVLHYRGQCAALVEERDTALADALHHKGQAEFLAKEMEKVGLLFKEENRMVGDLMEENRVLRARFRRRGYGWLWTAVLLGLAVATWAIVYLPAPPWVPGWMLR